MTNWPGPFSRWGRAIRFGTPAGTRLVGHLVRRSPRYMLREVRQLLLVVWQLLLVLDQEARERKIARLERRLEWTRTARGWKRLAGPLAWLWDRPTPGEPSLAQRKSVSRALRKLVSRVLRRRVASLLDEFRSLLDEFRSQRQTLRELWEREKARVRLHTNACGDFTMMAREDWLRLRGYAELEIFSMHIDSLLLYEAHYARIRQTLLPGAVYHLEHGGGFKPDAKGVKTLNEQLDRKAIPQVTYEQFLDWTIAMYRRRRPLALNGQDWGFGGQWLREATPGIHAPADRVQGAV
jgi:hypothetical protein